MNKKQNILAKCKSTFIYAVLIIVIITTCLIPLKNIAQCTRCLTDNMSLGTGYDHEANSFYSLGIQDQYWYLQSGPATHGPYPRCAISQDVWSQGFVSANSTRISVNASGFSEGNMQGNVNNCTFTGAPYRFQRDFCVYTGINNPTINGNLNIVAFLGDLNVSDIRLFGPGLCSPKKL